MKNGIFLLDLPVLSFLCFVHPDGPQFPHMPMQYPQHYHGPNQAHQPSHVFSTLLANQAAKAVYTGQANSIITFHQTLTANRKFLDPEQVRMPPWGHLLSL